MRFLSLLLAPTALVLATLAGAAAAPSTPDSSAASLGRSLSCVPPRSVLQSVAGEAPAHLPGVVVVKLRPDAPDGAWSALADTAGLWCAFPDGRTALLTVTPGQEQPAALALRQSPLVASAQPDYLRRLSVLPNDTRIGEQWALFKIKAPQAWDIATGSAVIVAVLDSGVDLGHPDLKGKLLDGYDFANDRPLPQDDNGHGTHVAGIVAAAANNSIGTAGVSWGARVLPVKVTNSFGATSDTVLASAIRFAADRGARVINMSLGGPEPSELLKDAVEYAAGKGALLVAAAGNCFSSGDSCGGLVNVPMYPAAYDKVTAVGATTFSDQHASYSETGPYLKLSAPGGDPRTPSDPASTMNILSTYWQPGLFGGYGALSGTSQAAPHVSGLAALIWALNPAFTPAQVEGFMTSTAVDLGQAGRDPVFGYGRIDAFAALRVAQAEASATPAVTPTPAPAVTPTPAASPTASPAPSVSPTATPTPTATPVAVSFAVAAGAQAQLGAVTVRIPPNVVTGETQATVSLGQFNPQTAPPGGLVLGTASFEVTLRGGSGRAITALAQPVTLTVRYSAADLSAAAGDPNSVILGVWSDETRTWTRIATVGDPAAGTVSASVNHLTKFSVLSVAPAALLDAPANGALLNGLALQLRWRLPAGVTQYQVQVIPANQDGPGLNLIRNAETGLDVPAPLLGQGSYILLPGMSYTWRVRLTGLPQRLQEGDPGWGAWQVRNFRTAAPTSATLSPASPAPGALVAGLRPALTWANSNPAIFYYEVQLSKDRTFETDPARAAAAVYWNLIHGGETAPLNTYALPPGMALEPGSVYFWRVRPRVQGDGTPVDWSPVWSFQTP